MTNLLRTIVLAAVLAVAVWLSRSTPRTTAPPSAPAAAPALPSPDHSFNGLAIQVNTSYEPIERFGPLIEEIAELGADTVMFSTAGYQEHAGAGVVYIDSRKTPTREQWADLFAIAQRNNLRVVLMPILLLSDPRGGEWRGQIQPPNWDKWFDSYRTFLIHFADIAQQHGAAVFMIGSELISTEKYTEQWLKAVADVRQHYQGLLGYSANWDHYGRIEFWDQLDLVGMTSYHTLADHPTPTVAELLDTWRPIREAILSWQATVNRPILFTEVGWCSQEGAATEPWNYYHSQTATAAGHEEQRRCYEAFMRTWQGQPGIAGSIWWEWTPDGGGTNCYNYTPRGKPAQTLLHQWFTDHYLPPSHTTNTPTASPSAPARPQRLATHTPHRQPTPGFPNTVSP